MAAPFRIRVNLLNCTHSGLFKPTKSWYLVNQESLNTIADLKSELIAKFNLVDQELLLSLDGFALPDWESILIIRDGDEVRLNGKVSSTCKEIIDNHQDKAKTAPQECLDALQHASETAKKSSPPKCGAKRPLETSSSSSSDSSSSSESSSSSSTSDDSSSSDGDNDDNKNKSESHPPKKFKASKSSDSESSSETSSSNEDTKPQDIPTSSLQKPEVQVKSVTNPASDKSNVEVPKKRRNRRRRRRQKQNPSEGEQKPDEDTITIHINSEDTSVAQTSTAQSTERSWPNGHAAAVTLNNQFYNVPKKKKAMHMKYDQGQDQRKHVCFDSDTEGGENPVEEVSSVPTGLSQTPDIMKHASVRHETTDNVTVSKVEAIECSPAASSSPANFAPQMSRKAGRKKDSPFAHVPVFTRNRRGIAAITPASQLNTKATNISTIYTNSPKEEQRREPEKDYTSFPALGGLPRTGDIIAFKMIEMNANYCPEVSAFKEAKVLNYNASQGSIEIQYLNNTSKAREAGRFDITVEGEDGILTNVESGSDTVEIQFSSMMDCRLLS